MSKTTLFLLAVSLPLAACDREPTSPLTASADELAPVTKSGSGLVRTEFPSADDPGPPFYARIESRPPHVFMVDEWAVVYFYRDPACIPADFNLLVFFDPPAAFGCAPAVFGHSLWQGEVFLGAPKIVQTHGGGAVEFWFVPVDALAAAIGDGVLTIGELAGLDGLLQGTAARFHEVLQPHPLHPFLGGGGHPNPKLIVNAQGTLEDGRRFLFSLVRQDWDVRSARLRFW
ncbi:MAG TPA: hypothetical protein VK922_00765 [Gemmatimonadaceae bacterium]|nr:hypothetical protein [Gemmatimonadaceae bacterium]